MRAWFAGWFMVDRNTHFVLLKSELVWQRFIRLIFLPLGFLLYPPYRVCFAHLEISSCWTPAVSLVVIFHCRRFLFFAVTVFSRRRVVWFPTVFTLLVFLRTAYCKSCFYVRFDLALRAYYFFHISLYHIYIVSDTPKKGLPFSAQSQRRFWNGWSCRRKRC